MLTEFEQGYVVGLLVGEGHFGGTGTAPQITLKMHVRHERLLRWVDQVLPGGRLYGPYEHDGRHFYQWMSRGNHLRNVMVPFLAARRAYMDDHVEARFLRCVRGTGLMFRTSTRKTAGSRTRGIR